MKIEHRRQAGLGRLITMAAAAGCTGPALAQPEDLAEAMQTPNKATRRAFSIALTRA